MIDSSIPIRQRLEARILEVFPDGTPTESFRHGELTTPQLGRVLDDLVAEWHSSGHAKTRQLATYMGLTRAEYAVFVEDAVRFARSVLGDGEYVAAEAKRRAIETFNAGVYRHYKGNTYLALGLARADETNETVVVYTRLYPREGLPMSTRTLKIWNETLEIDGQETPRFAFVGHESP